LPGTEETVKPFRLELTTEQLRLITDALPAMISEVDTHLHYVFVNKAYEDWFGIPYTTIPGRSVREVLGDEVYRFIEPYMKQALAGQRVGYENRIPDRQGRMRRVWVEYIPHFSPDRQVKGFFVLATDITDMKEAEEALRSSEARFHTLVDSMDDIVFTLDIEQRHTGVYGRWLQKYGLPPEFFLGKTAREILGPEAAGPHETANQFALTGEHVVYEWSFKHRNGNRHIQTSLSPLRGSRGDIIGIVGVGRDITDRKWMEEMLQKSRDELEQRVSERTAELSRANEQLTEEIVERGRMEIALGESEERFKAFMNHTAAVAWMKDEKGRYVYINQPFENRFNIKLDDIRGKTDFDLWPAEVAKQLHENDLAVLASDQTIQLFETVPTPDGSPHYWTVFKFPFKDITGRRFVGGMAFDITEKVELEQQVRQAEKLAAVGQLTSGLAHEIGTPLNVIAGRAEYMLRKMDPADPLRDNLDRILKQIERITKIVNQLLSFTRTKPLEVRTFALAPMLEGTLAFFEHQIKEQEINTVCEATDSLPPITADPDQIQQVFFNIILNAIQAMPQGGRLTLRAARTISRAQREDPIQDRYMRIEIADTGKGIPSEHFTKIFDPFFSTKEVGKGTGLGLSVCYSIIKNHGGWIDVKSRVGEGSAFTIYLPLEPPQPSEPTPSGRKAGG
jgi:PAS domain S-box-containing protein